MKEYIHIQRSGQIATVILNRPDKHNAMHPPLIKALSLALKNLEQDDSRIVILKGEGDHFCAGADIAWIQMMSINQDHHHEKDMLLLGDLFYQIYSFPKPIIALVKGAVRGGGMGLLATVDIAIAAEDANFACSEVKIGITPSMISPYLLNVMPERQARYYFLTGECFDAPIALDLGLIHQIVAVETLEDTAYKLSQTLLQNSPQALKSIKQLLREIVKDKITAKLVKETAKHLAQVCITKEAQEGLNAFLQKRKPIW